MELLGRLLTIFFVCVQASNGQQPCTNPLHHPGYCVIQDDCPPILAILNNPLKNHNDTKFMNDSVCGNDVTYGVTKLKFCCDSRSVIKGCVIPSLPIGGTYEIDGKLPGNGTRTPVRSVLKYKCHTNFKAEPNDTIYCQNDGNWNNHVICKQLVNDISVKTSAFETNKPIKLPMLTTTTSTTVTPVKLGSGKCKTPPYPNDGSYLVSGIVKPIGTEVEQFTVLIYKCNPGYVVDQEQPSSYCSSGQWIPEIKCKPLKTNKPTTLPLLTTTTSTTVRPGTSESGKCVTPPYPNDGSYLVSGTVKPIGTEVEQYTVLVYKCNPGYAADHKEVNSVCVNGKWQPEIKCKRKCENLISYTLELSCLFGGSKIDCDGPMEDGTIITTACKTFHEKPKIEHLKQLKCNDGKWNRKLPRCVPACGEDKSKSQEFAIGAKKAKVDSVPWHIGIYEKNKETHEYRCGGSIVSNKAIITAAHCFGTRPKKTNLKKTISYNKYRVAAGKYYSDWVNEKDDENDYVQKLEIENVHIPDTYSGHNLYMQSDVAVIIVKEMIEFSNFVHAICIDLDTQFTTEQLVNGKIGKVVGWGVTEEGNIKSVARELRESIVPVVNREICAAGVPGTFQRYTQVSDKFCAGSLNVTGPTVCTGDSGGGYTIKVGERGVDKWYLFGIVSVGPIEAVTGTTCKSNTYTLYTDISKHSEFILPILSDYV